MKLIEKISYLTRKGFSLFDAKPSKMTLDEIGSNIFPYLEDYEKMGFEFVSFPDEVVTIKKDGREYKCFGKCHLGCFLINDGGNVELIPTNNDVFDASYVYVNKSIDAFVRSYSMFMVSVFLLKSHFDNFSDYLNDESKRLRLNLLKIESEAIHEANFWSQIAYMMDDGILQIGAPLAYYMDNDRF